MLELTCLQVLRSLCVVTTSCSVMISSQLVIATETWHTPGNASHTLTSSDADDVFEDTDGDE